MFQDKLLYSDIYSDIVIKHFFDYPEHEQNELMVLSLRITKAVDIPALSL